MNDTDVRTAMRELADLKRHLLGIDAKLDLLLAYQQRPDVGDELLAAAIAEACGTDDAFNATQIVALASSQLSTRHRLCVALAGRSAKAIGKMLAKWSKPGMTIGAYRLERLGGSPPKYRLWPCESGQSRSAFNWRLESLTKKASAR